MVAIVAIVVIAVLTFVGLIALEITKPGDRSIRRR